MPQALALPPVFEDTPPHLEHESGLRVWFTEPVGLVTQLSLRVRADLAMAEFLATEVDERLFALPRAPGTKLVFVHDWRLLDAHGADVRKRMIEWAVHRRADIGEIVVVQGKDASRLARMGVSMASTALGMAGMRITTEPDIERAVSRRGLRPRPG